MEPTTTQISVNGKVKPVRSLTVDGQCVVITGGLFKLASIKDEDWLAEEPVPNPPPFMAAFREQRTQADCLTFAQQFWRPKPRHPYHHEWDNIAAIPLATFEDWWEKHVSHDLRKDVKRAEKRGLVVKPVPFNDDLVRGISGIYNECRVRQGRYFWHYGKDFESVKRENSSYLERSQFIGAYVGEEMIGFIKLVSCGPVARIMQIISKEKEQDKRPTNALISKAVEIACHQRCSYLTYGRYTYGNKKNSPLVQFKRRNGFEEILFPRYYVPLSLRGRLMIEAGLHLTWKRFIPEPLLHWLLDLRTKSRRVSVPVQPAVPAKDRLPQPPTPSQARSSVDRS